MKVLEDMIDKWLRDRKRKQDIKRKTTNLLNDLRENDELHRAKVLAMAAVFRHRVIDKSRQLSKALHSLNTMSQERIGLIVELLLAIQVQMIREKGAVDVKLEARQLKENSRHTHWDISLLGMDLWISTIGAGYHPKMRGPVREIWDLLSLSEESLPPAITALRDLEVLVNDLTPASVDMFGGMTDQTWIRMSRFRPSSVQ